MSITTLVLQDKPQGCTLFIFPQSLRALLSQTCISHMFVDNFRIGGAQITGKCILRVKKLKIDIFTHASPSKFLPQVLSTILYHPSRGKLLIPSPDAALFLKICFMKLRTLLSFAGYIFYVVLSPPVLFLFDIFSKRMVNIITF